MQVKKWRSVYDRFKDLPKARTTFVKCESVANAMNETNDCTVKAVAIAGKIPYETAHELMQLSGRKSREGSFPGIVSLAFRRMGAKEERVCTMALQKKNNGVGLTANNIARLLNKQRSYIAYTIDHVLTIRNGKVEDWTAGRRHKILSVHEISR